MFLGSFRNKFDARDAYAAAKTKYALEGGVSSTTMS